MVPQILSRSQRRMERQQAMLLLALVLAVSLVSFALGVMVGRGKAPSAPTAPPAARLPVQPPAGQDLTFYDSLPKGGKPPLGSGINLPASETAAKEVVPAPAQPQAGPAPTAQPPSAQESVQPTAPPAAKAEAVKPEAAKPEATKTVPAVPTSPSPVQAKAKPPAAGSWIIQAGSFRTVEDAERLKQRLAGKGFAVYVQAAALGEKGTWHRVMVGPFPSEGAASGAAGRLRDEEKLSVIVRKP